MDVFVTGLGFCPGVTNPEKYLSIWFCRNGHCNARRFMITGKSCVSIPNYLNGYVKCLCSFLIYLHRISKMMCVSSLLCFCWRIFASTLNLCFVPVVSSFLCWCLSMIFDSSHWFHLCFSLSWSVMALTRYVMLLRFVCFFFLVRQLRLSSCSVQ